MKHLLTLITICIISCSLGQNDSILEKEVVVDRLVNLVKKDCYFLGTGPNPSPENQMNMKTISSLRRLPFETLDSLFDSKDYKLRLYTFGAICSKDISKISTRHKSIFKDTTKIIMCTPNGAVNTKMQVGNFAKMNFDELNKIQKKGVKFPYDHNIHKKDSIIDDIFQTEIDYWNEINQFDSTSIETKKAQNIGLLHDEHHDLVYRTYIRSITDYLIESKNESLIQKFIELISVSTNSVDEVQACSFVKLYVAQPNMILELAQESKPELIKGYLKDHLEFCLDEDEYGEKKMEQLLDKLERN